MNSEKTERSEPAVVAEAPGCGKRNAAADKERIFRSYAALKSVFHRRGRELGDARRKIAELEERLAALERENARLSAAPDYASVVEDDAFLEGYAVKSERLKNMIIADYLKSIAGSGAVSVLSGMVGSSPLTPAAKPKSLAEAKKLAEILIKG